MPFELLSSPHSQSSLQQPLVKKTFQIYVKIVKIVLQSRIVGTATKNVYYYEVCVPSGFQGLPRFHEDVSVIKYFRR